MFTHDADLIGDGPTTSCPRSPRLNCRDAAMVTQIQNSEGHVRVRRDERLRPERGEMRVTPAIHVGYRCAVCGSHPIVGTLFKNLRTMNESVCGSCMVNYPVAGFYDATDFADGENRHAVTIRKPAATMAQMAPGLVPMDAASLGSMVPQDGENGAFLRAPQMADATSYLPAATNASQVPGIGSGLALSGPLFVNGGALGNGTPPAALFVRGYAGAGSGPPLSAAPQAPGATHQ